MAKVQFVVPNDVHRQIMDEARKRNMSKSQIYREMIMRGLGLPAKERGYKEGMLRGYAEQKRKLAE